VRFSNSKHTKMRLWRGGFAPDPIGEVYSAPPEPLLVSKEPLRGRGWVEKRGGEEEKEGSIPTSFLQFNNWLKRCGIHSKTTGQCDLDLWPFCRKIGPPVAYARENILHQIWSFCDLTFTKIMCRNGTDRQTAVPFCNTALYGRP